MILVAKDNSQKRRKTKTKTTHTHALTHYMYIMKETNLIEWSSQKSNQVGYDRLHVFLISSVFAILELPLLFTYLMLSKHLWNQILNQWILHQENVTLLNLVMKPLPTFIIAKGIIASLYSTIKFSLICFSLLNLIQELRFGIWFVKYPNISSTGTKTANYEQ